MKNEGKFQFLKLYFHGKVKKNKKGENVKLEFLLPNDHCKKNILDLENVGGIRRLVERMGEKSFLYCLVKNRACTPM